MLRSRYISDRWGHRGQDQQDSTSGEGEGVGQRCEEKNTQIMKTPTVRTGLTSDCTHVTVFQLAGRIRGISISRLTFFVFVDQFLSHKVRKTHEQLLGESLNSSEEKAGYLLSGDLAPDNADTLSLLVTVLLIGDVSVVNRDRTGSASLTC